MKSITDSIASKPWFSLAVILCVCFAPAVYSYLTRSGTAPRNDAALDR